jgi:cellulose synthase/poly-beta-1,6-N-acetylglucosamine synthase-like glycosyltransferase
MLELIGYVLVFFYLVCLLYIAVFCMMQLHYLFKYLTVSDPNKGITKMDLETEMPFVTIQLPIFNEKYVVERLIDNICMLHYPKDRFEVHILDDSTDETINLTKNKVAEYATKGFHIQCFRRENRKGYKAGALKEAMSIARGDFIAIFDADFLPKPDFLENILPYFSTPDVGVVQTRWEHINQQASLLTEMQAMQLNVHFTIEQKARYKSGYFLQFNGTAGMWRKSCITDAGGWEADTLTEDLDLSYRAQMKGWKIIYLEDVTAPAELPSEINGLKSQQYRWMKGGAETARKLLPKIWSEPLPMAIKIQATVHLLASSIFIFVFLVGVFSVPMLMVLSQLSIDLSKASIFLASLMSIILVYFVANVGVAWPKQNALWMLVKFILIFPVFMALSMAIAFHNSVAVIQGFLGKSSPFVRTPKYGATNLNPQIVQKKYFSSEISKMALCEGILALYFLIAILWAVHYESYAFIAMHVMLFAGYLMLFVYSLKSRFGLA